MRCPEHMEGLNNAALKLAHHRVIFSGVCELRLIHFILFFSGVYELRFIHIKLFSRGVHELRWASSFSLAYPKSMTNVSSRVQLKNKMKRAQMRVKNTFDILKLIPEFTNSTKKRVNMSSIFMRGLV
jgi:hypothetical protein